MYFLSVPAQARALTTQINAMTLIETDFYHLKPSGGQKNPGETPSSA